MFEFAGNYINEIDLRGQIIDNSPPSKTTAFLKHYAAGKDSGVGRIRSQTASGMKV